MKNIYIYVLLLGLLGFMSCEDDYEAPYPVTDVTWYTSMPNVTEYVLLQEEMMGFIDASQGALTHEWVIEEGSYFLTKDVKQGDSLKNFIDHQRGLKSEEKGVNIYFAKPGRKSVRLTNTYPEKVYYDGARPLEAKQVNGVWVIDTTFMVDVYGPIEPAYQVSRVVVNEDGSLSAGELILNVGSEDIPNSANSDSWKSVSVEVGEQLMFIDLTKDNNPEFIQPNTRTWTIKNNQEPSSYKDSVTVVYFNVYGFQAVGLGNILSERTTVGAPNARAQKIIPLKLKVVQSSQPFTYADGAVWTSPKSLAFNVTGEVKSLGIDVQSAFTVHVQNAAKGINKDLEVTAVAFSQSNATRIELTLSEAIYGDDVITVSFKETGTSIQSVDERPFKSFSAQTVEMPVGGEDILGDWKAWSGFEEKAGLNAGGALRYFVGAQDANNPEWMRDVSMYFSGEASMKYNGNINASTKLFGIGFADKGEIPAGAYRISHKIYIVKGSDIKVLRTDIANNNGGSFPSTPSILWDLENVKRGEWVTISQIVDVSVNVDAWQGPGKPAASRYSYYVEGALNPGVKGNQTFYLDDMEMVKVDAGIRP